MAKSPWGNKQRGGRKPKQHDESKPASPTPKLPLDKKGKPREPRVTLQELYQRQKASRFARKDIDKVVETGVSMKSIKEIRPKDHFKRAGKALEESGYRVFVGKTNTEDNGHTHTVLLLFMGDKFGPKTKVLIGCNCPRYLYRYEYANWKAGCGFIYYSNGERPKHTNPGLVTGGCKHCVRVMSHVLRVHKSLNR